MTETSRPTITLRSPTADELRDFYAPVVVAFGSDFSEPEFLAEAPLFEPERLVNAFDGEERVAGGGAFSMRLSLPGGAGSRSAASPRSVSGPTTPAGASSAR